MGGSEGVLQDTLDKDVENFWDVLENIMNSDSKDTKAELAGAIKRFENRLKESVSQSDISAEEKEEKLFEIEIMINELENKLESFLYDEGDEGLDEVKSSDSKSEESKSQMRIDEYPDRELESLKKDFRNIDL